MYFHRYSEYGGNSNVYYVCDLHFETCRDVRVWQTGSSGVESV